MMILSEARSKSRHRWKSLAPYVFLSIFLLSAILAGDAERFLGSLQPTLLCSSIAQRKKVSFRQAALWLLPLGIVVLLLVAYRSALHLGPQTSTEELPSADIAFEEATGPSEYDKEHGSVAEEFILSAAVLDTVDQTGKLDYGRDWVTFLVINPIPKLLWPQKHYPDTIGITSGDIDEQTGIVTDRGSAAGIVADLYTRFQLFSAIFFFALGLGLRRLFVAARNLSSPLTSVGYVMVYALSLNVFAQGFGSIFVALPYSMAPVVVFAWATRRSQQRARLRRKEITLRQVAALHSEL